MKKFFLLLSLAGLCLSAAAQNNEVIASYGFQIPLSGQPQGGSQITLTYAHYFNGYLGAQISGQYMPVNMGIPSAAAVPVALSISRGFGFYDAVHSAGLGYSRAEHVVSEILVTFLQAIFQRSSLYAGVTPGWYLGDISTQPLSNQDPFFLTLDVGANLAIPIGPVSINVIPSAHYYLKHNFDIIPSGASILGRATPWQINVAFGLGYAF